MNHGCFNNGHCKTLIDIMFAIYSQVRYKKKIAAGITANLDT